MSNDMSFARIKLNSVEENIIKNYLWNLYTGNTENKNIRINKIIGISSFETPVAQLPNKYYNTSSNDYTFNDSLFIASLTYNSESYELVVKQIFDKFHGIFEYHITVKGSSEQAKFANDLISILIDVGTIESSYTNSVIKLKNNQSPKGFIEKLQVIKLAPQKLEDLFISDIKKDQLRRFIKSIKNFENDHISLRYLLNGPPGTGKTQIINSIINEVHGDLTILITNGEALPLDEIFKFCLLFKKVLWIIDDFDFIVEDRNRSYSRDDLGKFLQFLDGLLPNNVFMLASTNDKSLVDLAAARPGRFDLILDIGEIHPQYYLKLIKRETDDNEIIDFFSDPVIERMKMKKLSGAYIVSFVKQLKSLKAHKGKIEPGEFDSYFDIIYNGFYSNNDEENRKVVGF